MRTALLLLLSCALAACNSGGRADSGSGAPTGPAGTRSFTVGGFDGVSLRGPDDVVVRAGSTPSVSATGDRAVLDHLKVKVVGTELRVGRESGWTSKGHAVVTVVVPSLKAASVAGSGDMKVDRIAAPHIAVAISGSGALDVATAEAGSADLAISGSGDLTIAGRADRVSLSVTGSGDLDAGKLQGGSAAISTVGSGDVSVTAHAAADISLIGSGSVTVRGGAHCTVTKLGSGEVDCDAQPRVASGDKM